MSIVPYFMIKSFLILIHISILLFSSEQIILVVSDDFNKSVAKLACYEGSKQVFLPIEVNIGRNGLGWGIGEIQFSQKSSEPLKVEGDGRAPIGVFKLSTVFGYAKEASFKMPYFYTSKKLICVDDGNSQFYNKIIEAHGDEKSFEFMQRKDNQYKLGIVVQHNTNAIINRGSCIFMHIQKGIHQGTAGCTSMREEDIEKIAQWLDKNKNPILIQVPQKLKSEIIKRYPVLKESVLFKAD